LLLATITIYDLNNMAIDRLKALMALKNSPKIIAKN